MCGAAYGSSVVDVRRGFEDCGLMLWRRARASRLNYAEGSEGSQGGVLGLVCVQYKGSADGTLVADLNSEPVGTRGSPAFNSAGATIVRLFRTVGQWCRALLQRIG
jgi:hypothetical protein